MIAKNEGVNDVDNDVSFPFLTSQPIWRADADEEEGGEEKKSMKKNG